MFDLKIIYLFYGIRWTKYWLGFTNSVQDLWSKSDYFIGVSFFLIIIKNVLV